MATKRAIYTFDSDRNQLPYAGAPATYCDWATAIGVVVEDSEFDDDGVPVKNNVFTLNWDQLGVRYSPVLLRYRVRDDQLGVQSNWSVPVTVYTAVRYAVYKRRVATDAKNWTLVEVTKSPTAGPYQENWAGRVQYAVCIHHVDAKPSPSEGELGSTDFTNPYVLFATDPTSTTMNTKPFIF